MTIENILSAQAPQPFKTYSQAIKTNSFLFVSGQLPIAPTSTKIISANPIEQIKQCFENIKAICESAGSSLDMAVKINVYYTDIEVSENISMVM